MKNGHQKMPDTALQVTRCPVAPYVAVWQLSPEFRHQIAKDA